MRDSVGRLVLLEEGQTHPFLPAESRNAIRRNVPQKKPEQALVDMPVVTPVPAPPRDGHDGIFHRGKRSTTLEQKIKIARSAFEMNPKWQRQAAQMTKSTDALRAQRSPGRGQDRTLSRSYLPRFKRDRYNFDTGIARNSVDEWQSTKALYYSPGASGTTVPPHRFANSLRSYMNTDDSALRKRQEKQMHRRWKLEAREYAEHAAAAEAEAEAQRSSTSRDSARSRPTREELHSDDILSERGDETVRCNTAEDGFLFLGHRRPLEVSPVLQAAIPQELETFRAHNVSLELERLLPVAEKSVTSIATVSYEGIEDATRRHHLATPQITPTHGSGQRAKSAHWRSQHTINVGIANAEIRDLHHCAGPDEVDKLLSERFVQRRAPDESGADSGDGSMGPESQAERRRRAKSIRAKSAAAERRQRAAEEAAAEVAAAAEEDARAEAERAAVDAASCAEEKAKKHVLSPTGRRRPRPKEDATIFGKIIHKAVGTDEIPKSSPVWLSYAVYDSEPEEEEETELAKALRAIRMAEAQEAAEQQPAPVGGGSAANGAASVEAPGGADAKRSKLRDLFPMPSEADAVAGGGKAARHRWKKGGVTLRGLEMPAELAARFEDREKWPLEPDGRPTDALMLLNTKAQAGEATGTGVAPPVAQRAHEQRQPAHGPGAQDQARRRQRERDLHLMSLTIASAEGVLNPIQAANRSRR
eukprot:jgi/Tetstr1/435946/TSEL_024827.t1